MPKIYIQRTINNNFLMYNSVKLNDSLKNYIKHTELELTNEEAEIKLMIDEFITASEEKGINTQIKRFQEEMKKKDIIYINNIVFNFCNYDISRIKELQPEWQKLTEKLVIATKIKKIFYVGYQLVT